MRTLAALVFPGFQTLDLYGPLEMLGDHDIGAVDIKIVAETLDPVPSYHGTRTTVDRTIAESSEYDLILIPGGDSAPLDPRNDAINDWIIEASANAEYVMAVCTGTVLLATTGLLDGRRATTNKKDYTATIPYGPNVKWAPQARWVEDGKFFTSSGVSAGMDMSLAVMAKIFGQEAAEAIAVGTEYDWRQDPQWDPFAKLAGLV
ncbi:MAG: DJ-1/PfpI family protein [Rhodobacteraceae bacterium]|nr:DJ-1/PfpI family protein [Paracoccaceae bacterium]